MLDYSTYAHVKVLFCYFIEFKIHKLKLAHTTDIAFKVERNISHPSNQCAWDSVRSQSDQAQDNKVSCCER